MIRVLCVLPYSQSSIFKLRLKSVEELKLITSISWDCRGYSLGIGLSKFIPVVIKNILFINYNRIVKRLKFLKKTECAIRKYFLIFAANYYKVDIILTMGRDEWFDDGLLKKLKDMGILTAHHHPDNYDHFESFCIKKVPYYDYFFHFDSKAVTDLKKLGFNSVYHIPFGCSEELINKYKNTEIVVQEHLLCDVGFAGDMYEGREEVMSHLTDFDLKIFGSRLWKETALKDFYQNKYLDNSSELFEFYKLAKIVVNPHFKGTGYGINYRFWEVATVGGFQLTTPQKEIFDLFEVGQDKDIDVYYSMQDLKEKIKFYLGNDEIRLRMSKRLNHKVAKSHTYNRYHKEMFDIIST
jgi:spore maturation protein CgeB